MEGNFYISDVVIDRELESKYGQAYQQCRTESRAYGSCIEAGQINRNLSRDYCRELRIALRTCVDGNLKRMGRGGLPPNELQS